MGTHAAAPRPDPLGAGTPVRSVRRTILVAAAVAFMALGVWGAWSYAHAYDVYRGFAPPVDAAGVPAGRLVHLRFHSPAFHTMRSVAVYLPPGYARAAAHGRRFPVLYFLHGSPGWPDLVLNAGALGTRLDTLVHRHRIQPFIVAMPDGRDGTFTSDTEWANTPHGPYEALVLEAMRAVDRHFATIPTRAGRAIAGNSEGAYGAVNIGLQHLRQFSVIESWSGYFTQSRGVGVFAHASSTALRRNSPLDYVGTMAPQLRRLPTHMLLYGGAADHDSRLMAPFVARLRRLPIHYTARVVPGGHSWGVWRHEMAFALRYASAHLAAPASQHTTITGRPAAASTGRS